MATKKPRGKSLDDRLKYELELMLNQGHKLAPISRSTLQRRLKLTSRGTLSIKHRAEMIENARIEQLKIAGLDSTGKKRRNTIIEQNENLKKKIQTLEQERDSLIEKLAMIINGIQAKGYNLEELMMPIRTRIN